MKRKRLKKKLEKFSGRYFIYFVIFFINTMPDKMLNDFSQVLGTLAFYLSKKRRVLTVTSLTYAFKNEKSPHEIKKLAKKVLCEIVWGGIDTARLFLKNSDVKKTLMEDTSVEGTEYLDEALKKKKGVICVTAHFGYFTVMPLRLSLMGYPCNMLVKDPDDSVVAEMLEDIRRNAGIQWIPARPRVKAVSESLRWINGGGILFIHADQNKNDGIYVDFLNRPAGTVEGPALLYLRTGAELLCAFSIRLSRNKHKIVITPPVQVPKTGDRKEDSYQITKAYTKIIEDFVRQYPEQWYWAHNRWKGSAKHQKKASDV